MANLADFLFPYQKEWLADTSRYKIWEKSRRIGATYVQSLEDVLDCLKKPRLAVWFSSADDSAAKEYIIYCAHWAKAANAVASKVSEEIMDERDDITVYNISFKNGSRINAMSSNLGVMFIAAAIMAARSVVLLVVSAASSSACLVFS